MRLQYTRYFQIFSFSFCVSRAVCLSVCVSVWVALPPYPLIRYVLAFMDEDIEPGLPRRPPGRRGGGS